mmetsp:Transcript_22683/g.37257  ORF Transcript_22683/g.37257 Transcript_22683/m.37257 type:complete len:241 (+) Transcript_22683:2598-3320(+)
MGMLAVQPGAIQRRVGCDDGADPRVLGHFGDVGEVLIRQVGGDLEEDRHLAPHLHHTIKQGGQCHRSLQVAQLFGVGAGDVDGRKVDMIAAVFQHAGKVVGFAAAVLVGTQIEANGHALGTAGQPGTDRVHPVIVEPKSVDGGGVLGQPKEPWFGIAGLCKGCGGPHLDPAEPRPAERRDGGGVLVKAGGKANGVGQIQTRQGGAQTRRGHWPRQGNKWRAQGCQCQSMCCFGVHAPERS